MTTEKTALERIKLRLKEVLVHDENWEDAFEGISTKLDDELALEQAKTNYEILEEAYARCGLDLTQFIYDDCGTEVDFIGLTFNKKEGKFRRRYPQP